MTPTPKECHDVLAQLLGLYDKYGVRAGFTDTEAYGEIQGVVRSARNLERRLFKAINGDIDGIWDNR